MSCLPVAGALAPDAAGGLEIRKRLAPARAVRALLRAASGDPTCHRTPTTRLRLRVGEAAARRLLLMLCGGRTARANLGVNAPGIGSGDVVDRVAEQAHARAPLERWAIRCWTSGAVTSARSSTAGLRPEFFRRTLRSRSGLATAPARNATYATC